MTTTRPEDRHPPLLSCATVVGVTEHACQVWTGAELASLRFAPRFPSPRAERVAPGHLVAVATAPDGKGVVLWRWYDAVVLGAGEAGSVRLWEPAHGEVVAEPRPSHRQQEPGSRAYASAGLAGADWWVAGRVTARPEDADVEVGEVDRLYTDNGLWASALTRGD